MKKNYLVSSKKMRMLALFITALTFCSLPVKAQESEKFSNTLNSSYQKLSSIDPLKSLSATPYFLFDAYNLDKIFIKIFGNEDYNKVMILMINNTNDSLSLYLPEGMSTFRNPCGGDTYTFYSPERIDIDLGQEDKFILINQAGTKLIGSGSALFTDTYCSYFNFSTRYLYDSIYEPILDDDLQKLLPFNTDTSTLQQVFGDKNGYILVQRNYHSDGLNSRYIYLHKAFEGEIYTELTTDWVDSAYDAFTSHDFIIELEDNQKIIRSVEVPEIKITNTGLQGTSGSVFTIVIENDLIAPELSIADNLPYQPEFIEVTSTEDGIIYLVPENTDKDLTIICGACIDSVTAVANSPSNVSLSGLDNGQYWLYARDGTGNISEPKAFSIMGVGIDNTSTDQIRLYPNPANNLLVIETNKVGQYTIELNSINGQLIYSDKTEGPTCQIDLSSFQKGVYFITIRSTDFVKTEKIIKL
jgi:hypothetical protein